MKRLLLYFVLAISGCFSATAQEPDFENQVLAILTKAGCNSGACHGAAIGRGGFQLSLFGQNPDADWTEIARKLNSRRIDVADPENSLLLRKAGEFIEHGGGLRLAADDPDWKTLVDWIGQGGKRHAKDSAGKLLGIELQPQQLTDTLGKEVPVSVWGLFSDGSKQDLTNLALLQPQDPASLQLNQTKASVCLQRPGRHTLLARVRDHVAVAEVLVPLAESSEQQGPDSKAQGSTHPSLIDSHINRRLRDLNLEIGPRADDATLLRRLYLDLIGQLPSPAQVIHFIEDNDPHKTDKLINQLLADDACSTKWTHWFASSLKMSTVLRGEEAEQQAQAIFSYIQANLEKQDFPHQLFAEMTTSEGRLQDNPAVAFYLLANDARQQAEQFSELFLGVQMACANCHNHPLDKWKQDDYHGLAAIFAGIRRGETISWRAGAINMHPATGDAAIMQLPSGRQLTNVPSAAEPTESPDPRLELADWLVNDGRSQVAISWTNRVWAELFGKGLVDPVADLRTTNPPTHSELLLVMSQQWQRSQGGLKWLLREIVSSDAYQRATVAEPASKLTLQQNLSVDSYGYRQPKPISGPVLIDVFSQVTGVWKPIGKHPVDTGYPVGTRAVSVLLPEPTSAARQAANNCNLGNCETDLAQTLAGRLALIAGPMINDRLTSSSSQLTTWADDPAISHEQLIDKMYLTFFCRPPTTEESAHWTIVLDNAEDPHATIQDIVWSMLTSSHFLMND